MLDAYVEVISLGLTTSLLMLNLALLENIAGNLSRNETFIEYGKRTLYGAILLAAICLAVAKIGWFRV
ncbi:MAG: hypothetical protein ACP5NE_01740 [Candidatus Micrarchaeia archaeon]